MKNKKGITVITLIITIIVILILATVSINMLTGENGILEKAKIAKEKSVESNDIEQSRLGDYNNYIDKYTTRSGDNSELESRVAALNNLRIQKFKQMDGQLKNIIMEIY